MGIDFYLQQANLMRGYTDPLVVIVAVSLAVVVIVVIISASTIDSHQRRIRNEDRLLDTLERIRQENIALTPDEEELVRAETQDTVAQSSSDYSAADDEAGSSPQLFDADEAEIMVGLDDEVDPGEAEIREDNPQLEAEAQLADEPQAEDELLESLSDSEQEASPAVREDSVLDDELDDDLDDDFDDDLDDDLDDEGELLADSLDSDEEFEDDDFSDGKEETEALVEVVCDPDGFCYTPIPEDAQVSEDEIEPPNQDASQADSAEENSAVEEAVEDESAEATYEDALEDESVEDTLEDTAEEEPAEEEDIAEDTVEDTAAEESANLNQPEDKPESKKSRLRRLKERLAGTGGLGKVLLGMLSRAEISAQDWGEIEDTLLSADLGIDPTIELMEKLQTRQKVEGTTDPSQVRKMAAELLLELLDPELDRSLNLQAPEDSDSPTVGLLMVGVNGAGKTTTVGKLARFLVAENHSVVLGAADTFRAAAGEQLQTWGETVGVPVVRSAKDKADPASVAFDAARRAKESQTDVVLIDTAGRLQNKSDLMDQLGKIKRVTEKQVPVTETLLVIDATTGQNALSQAQIFTQAVGVTGIVLTKLDGSAKGGIVVSVQRELGLPVKLVGLGEGPDDLVPFVPADFVEALLDA